MDTQEALNFLTSLMHKCTETAEVEKACEALQTLAKALEWQPMESAPKDRDILAEVVDDYGYQYKVVLSYDKHSVSVDLWMSECNSFTQRQIVRWKEVE